MGNFPTEKNPQELMNFWTDYSVNPPTLTAGQLEFTGAGYAKKPSSLTALKMTQSGSITYIAIAPIGSSQASATWQAKKIDESVSGTMTITWADGDSNFDNVATDLTALSYL